jgi:fructose-1-phosphate kinase PfkB-like protein
VEPLRKALEAGVYMIKPNGELAKLVGVTLEMEEVNEGCKRNKVKAVPKL